jgi:predicted ATPase
MMRDYLSLKMGAENLLRLGIEHDLPYCKAIGSLWIAWLRAKSEGVKGMRDALKTYQNLGLRAAVPFFLGLLAIAHQKAGEIGEGLRIIVQALSLVEVTSDRWSEAELLRLRGELLLAGNRPNVDEAEASYLKAIDVARRQSAKTWELRAATSLARLWRDIGRPAEAHDVLAPVYGWFTEGFDLPDLKDARTLLDELNPDIGKTKVAG